MNWSLSAEQAALMGRKVGYVSPSTAGMPLLSPEELKRIGYEQLPGRLAGWHADVGGAGQSAGMGQTPGHASRQPEQGGGGGAMGNWQAGVDVGGTFTDLVVVDRGTALPRHEGPLDARRPVARRDGRHPRKPAWLPEVAALSVHGTTVGTNAILERKGVVCGLITTVGFRDVLELGRTHPPLRLRHDRQLRAAHPAPAAPRGAGADRCARQRAACRSTRTPCAAPIRSSWSPTAPRRWSSASCIPTSIRRTSGGPPRSRASCGPNPFMSVGSDDPARGPRVRAHHDRGGQRLHPADHGALPRRACGRTEARPLPPASCWSCRATAAR